MPSIAASKLRRRPARAPARTLLGYARYSARQTQTGSHRPAQTAVRLRSRPVPIYTRDPWNVKGDIEERIEAARQRVAALGDLEPQAGFGDPVHELAGYGQSVDLLVIGGHKYRPVDHLLEQSTAQRLAHEVSTPLLVLPPAETS